MDASRDSRDISLRIDFVSSIKSGIEPKGGEGRRSGPGETENRGAT